MNTLFCKRSNDNYLQTKNELYEEGDIINVDYDTFIYQFDEFTCYLLTNLVWNNIVVAGGSILQCMLTRKNNYFYKSDVDIFIYGNEEDKKKTFQYLVNYLKKYDAYIERKGASIVNIYFKEYLREFQIIYSSCITKEQVIEEFDADYIRVLFDGTNVICSKSYMNSLITQSTDIFSNVLSNEIVFKRIVKALDKGFSIKNWNETLGLQEVKKLDREGSFETVIFLKQAPLSLVDLLSEMAGYEKSFLRSLANPNNKRNYFALTDDNYPDYVIQRYKHKMEKQGRNQKDNDNKTYETYESLLKTFAYESLKTYISYHGTLELEEGRKMFYLKNVYLSQIVEYNEGQHFSMTLKYLEKHKQSYKEMIHHIWDDKYYQSEPDIRERHKINNLFIDDNRNKIYLNNLCDNDYITMKKFLNKNVTIKFRIRKYKPTKSRRRRSCEMYGYKIIIEHIYENFQYKFVDFYK